MTCKITKMIVIINLLTEKTSVSRCNEWVATDDTEAFISIPVRRLYS